jgi:hypothetical protein
LGRRIKRRSRFRGAHDGRVSIWINLVDTNREDWSFGDGEMQYAPK